VSENRVLRKKFELKRNEVTREWRSLHKVELCGLHNLANISALMKKNEIGGTYGTYVRRGEEIEDFGWET
jgi:hypothetical protein